MIACWSENLVSRICSKSWCCWWKIEFMCNKTHSLSLSRSFFLGVCVSERQERERKWWEKFSGKLLFFNTALCQVLEIISTILHIFQEPGDKEAIGTSSVTREESRSKALYLHLLQWSLLTKFSITLVDKKIFRAPILHSHSKKWWINLGKSQKISNLHRKRVSLTNWGLNNQVTSKTHSRF